MAAAKLVWMTTALLLGACGDNGQDMPTQGTADAGQAATDGGPAGQNAATADRASWDLQSSDEGVALVLAAGSGPPAIRLLCQAAGNKLLVNVPAFRAIGSEERLSFGGGGEAVALVADTTGDEERGGVSGTGAVPANLAALLSGSVSASYGAQTSGPHPPPPEQLADAFAAACSKGAKPSPAPAPGPAGSSGQEAGACRMEDGKVLPPNRLKAVGTEPFWAARIEGRCVTYMTPENQSGTRIWASFDGSRDSGVWTGYYQDQRFVLRTRPSPGCSDGMSDKRYPVGVTLVVGGEERTGCAEYP